jgi:hypothetical protein
MMAAGGVGQGGAGRAGVGGDAGLRLVAQAPLGDVDDALEGQRVVRRVDEAQIGERVADLGALVEAEAADDAVGQADRDEAFLELARLVLGADEDGDRVEARAFAGEAFGALADEAGFLRVRPTRRRR